MRRAGWSVRFLPQVKGSYEEVPATLIDYVLRDRRWCQGNLQHLGLLRARGFHAVSRFHLLSGAMGYLMSPAWFMLLLVWALIGDGMESNALQYFQRIQLASQLAQHEHRQRTHAAGFHVRHAARPQTDERACHTPCRNPDARCGGVPQFLTSLTAEILLSIAYAPILMVQQTIAVARTMLGIRETWTPQQRRGKNYSFGVMLKFHLLETVLGTLLIAGMASGLVTLWLLPITISLALAVPLSALSGVNLGAQRWSARQLGTPEHLNAPPIIRSAMKERRRFAAVVADPDVIAAE